MPMMSDHEEDLDDFEAENIDRLRILGWSMSRRINRSMDSRKWEHYEDSTTF